jgi:uncharacterized LabA/DUF88 family protein
MQPFNNNNNNVEPRRRLFKAVYIDGPFLFHASSNISIKINYKKLIQSFLNTGDFLSICNYYTALPNEYDMDDKHKNFIKILKKDVKLRIRSVPLLKTPTEVSTPSYRYSKGEDLLLAIDMAKAGILGYADHFYLVSGDGDFTPLVELLLEHGRVVTVVSFHGSLSHALELVASDVIYLDEILEKIQLI